MTTLFQSLVGAVDFVKEVFATPLITLGDVEISLGLISYFVIAFSVLFYLSGMIKRLLVRRVLNKAKVEQSTAESIASIARFLFISIGFFVVLQGGGVNLSSLSILAGALGVGIGFGLQNIANNFLSGLVILLERPIKIGDRIEVDGISGNVKEIAARSTTIQTNDNIALIIPNSKVIESPVINWSYNLKRVRLRIPLSVSYKEDPEYVKKVAIEVMNKQKGILQSPKPDLLFKSFGESSLDFSMCFWTREYLSQKEILVSALNYEIFKVLKEKGIEIPYPQRDIHVKSFISEKSEKNE